MRGGYLAFESSHDSSYCVGCLNNGRITIKKCTGRSGLKSQSAKISRGMRCGRQSDKSKFQPMAEVSFPILVSPANTQEKTPLLAEKENPP